MTKGGKGEIKLRCSDPAFATRLAEVEQILADTGATDIVYFCREEREGDFLSPVAGVQSTMFDEE